MKLRRLFGFMMLVASGGMVFQATAGCTEQLVGTLATTVVSLAADVLIQALVSGIAT